MKADLQVNSEFQKFCSRLAPLKLTRKRRLQRKGFAGF